MDNGKNAKKYQKYKNNTVLLTDDEKAKVLTTFQKVHILVPINTHAQQTTAKNIEQITRIGCQIPTEALKQYLTTPKEWLEHLVMTKHQAYAVSHIE